jgi:hypothetical protein
MINWNEYDATSESDWARLASQIISTAQVAVQALDDAKMADAANDNLDYAARPAFCKPDWAVQALRRAQAQLTAARQDLALGILKSGSDKMDTLLARMSSAGAELKAEAARLSLQPVRDALTLALELTNEVKSVESDVKNLTKNDIAGRLAVVLQSLEKLREKLGNALA